MDDARTDEEVAIAVTKGEAEAFGSIIERYEPKLMRYGQRFLADRDDVADVVQEVFIKAYRNLRGFDPSQRLSPWLYRIAHNAFVSELRKRSRYAITLPEFDTFLAHVPAEETAEGEAQAREVRALVDQGLSKLSPNYREVLILFYLEELSYREIADVLHIPVGTVSVRLRRAKAALASVYQTLTLMP